MIIVALVIVIYLHGCVVGGLVCADIQTSGALVELSASSPQAKNVILMIGDGMGRNQVEAARLEKAGYDPAAYRTTRLALDSLDYMGNLTTASANNAVTDSAAAATALMTGVKTNNGYIGVNPSGVRLTTIAELADAGGRATGVITTTRTTDATPAGAYAHVTSRTNEDSIASQFLDTDLEVALGGGYSYFISTATTDPWGVAGSRTDGRDIVAEAKGQGYTLATTASGLSGAPATSTTKVLGLFDSANLAYENARASTQQPTLAAMTGKALSVLSTDPDGFFLMVEGGKIDKAASAGNYAFTTEQVLTFDDAVATALSFAAQHPDTLVIVTADHETGGLTVRTKADGTLSFSFTTTGHTAIDVPIRASGPSAERFSAVTVPNTQVFTVMRDTMNLYHVVVMVHGGLAVPRDPHGDGLYEDVNGDGRKDFADVFLYFNQISWIAANEPVTAFDYNGNGRVDVADVVWHFNHQLSPFSCPWEIASVLFCPYR